MEDSICAQLLRIDTVFLCTHECFTIAIDCQFLISRPAHWSEKNYEIKSNFSPGVQPYFHHFKMSCKKEKQFSVSYLSPFSFDGTDH